MRERKTNRPSRFHLSEPSKMAWIRAATEAAQEAGVRPVLVLCGTKTIPVMRARWKAWRKVKEENPKVSLAGIGRVSGFHHTSVRYGILRDRGEDYLLGAAALRKLNRL